MILSDLVYFCVSSGLTESKLKVLAQTLNGFGFDGSEVEESIISSQDLNRLK